MTTVTQTEYWQNIVADPTKYGQIETTDPDFNKRAGCIYRVLETTLIKRENAALLVQQWEEQLGLTPAADATHNDRKVAILCHISEALPCPESLLEKALEFILGEGNFSLTHDKEANKVTLSVALDLDFTDAMRADVQTLLDRVLPRNLVTEMEWADGLPIDYTHVEFLEGNANAYIDSEVLPTDETEIRAVLYFTPNSYVETHTVSNKESTLALKLAPDTYIHWGSTKSKKIGNLYKSKFKGELVFRRGYASYCDRQATFDCDSFAENPATSSVLINTKSRLQSDGNGMNRWYDCRIYENGTQKRAYIPALDPTGTPCMYDLITKTPFYNNGTGDFLYPGAEQAVQTTDLDLDSKFYAKMTSHGIRRLYHVPKGYTSSMDEYAAANGFKELVEPPMPQTGYWEPEWRETETQLICDWVETEPPAEESFC